MKKSDEYSYIKFPLCLLREFFDDPGRAFGLISGFGIINFAKSIEPNMEEVARQLIYNYYNNTDLLQKLLLTSLVNYVNNEQIIVDEDYRGFNGLEGNKCFTPEGEIFSIKELFEKDPNFKDQAVLSWQIGRVVSSAKTKRPGNKLLNVSVGNNIDNLITRYYEANNIKSKFENKYNPDCWASCKTDMLFEFRDSGKDLDLFRAFMAIKSIIGPHRYTATTRNVILMRMMGCKSNQALNDFIKQNKAAKQYHELYTRSEKALRYHFDKLFDTLLSRGFLKSKIFERKVSRKIFISHVLSYDELANEIINFHSKHQHQQDENRAIEKIRATI